MKELSLNILDITENSVKAGAELTSILIDEENNTLRLTIEDNGSGMSEEILKGVTDPFYTTRTTRKVGMGLPLLKLAAEQTGELVHQTACCDLCLDSVDHSVDLIVRQIDADNALDCLDRILLELGCKILIILDLADDFFDFCFDIHFHDLLKVKLIVLV